MCHAISVYSQAFHKDDDEHDAQLYHFTSNLLLYSLHTWHSYRCIHFISYTHQITTHTHLIFSNPFFQKSWIKWRCIAYFIFLPKAAMIISYVCLQVIFMFVSCSHPYTFLLIMVMQSIADIFSYIVSHFLFIHIYIRTCKTRKKYEFHSDDILCNVNFIFDILFSLTKSFVLAIILYIHIHPFYLCFGIFTTLHTKKSYNAGKRHVIQ